MMTSAVRINILSCALCLLAIPTGSAQSRSSLAGTVTTDDGRGVAGVHISATPASVVPRLGIAASVTGRIAAEVQSDAGGRFAFAGLPDGGYQICVSQAPKGYLDPCQWTALRPGAEVSANVAPREVRLRLLRASTLAVQVNDPGEALKRPVRILPGPTMSLTVVTPLGIHIPLQQVSTRKGLEEYQISIPVGVPLRLRVTSPTMRLESDDKAPVPEAGKTVSILHSREAAASEKITFNVLGAR